MTSTSLNGWHQWVNTILVAMMGGLLSYFAYQGEARLTRLENLTVNNPRLDLVIADSVRMGLVQATLVQQIIDLHTKITQVELLAGNTAVDRDKRTIIIQEFRDDIIDLKKTTIGLQYMVSELTRRVDALERRLR